MRDICGEHVIVSEGKENIDFSNVISLNESAAYLWTKAAEKGTFNIDDLAEMLTGEYDVDEKTALKDAEETVREWYKTGIIED